jgi:hypothetical protein
LTDWSSYRQPPERESGRKALLELANNFRNCNGLRILTNKISEIVLLWIVFRLSTVRSLYNCSKKNLQSYFKDSWSLPVQIIEAWFYRVSWLFHLLTADFPDNTK